MNKSYTGGSIEKATPNVPAKGKIALVNLLEEVGIGAECGPSHVVRHDLDLRQFSLIFPYINAYFEELVSRIETFRLEIETLRATESHISALRTNRGCSCLAISDAILA